MSAAAEPAAPARQGWGDLWRTFGRIGLLSFGGPAAQIALMHRVLVDERRWLSEEEYLRALSFCMLLPGPEAMQLATYAGWRLRGVPGGLLAGLLFVLPGAAVIMALSALYAAWGGVPLVAALFFGVKACVVVIVVEALLRVARRALKSVEERVFAGLSFLALYAFQVPFPLVILAAALAGAWLFAKAAPAPMEVPAGHGRLAPVLGLGAAFWAAPLLIAWAAGSAFLTALGLFFSKLALVTFGGAYAVLAYMTQEVVQDHGWLTTAEMMDGLGLAETTPGPLILVAQFVGFLAGFKLGGWVLAALAALLTLWVTFVPCFLWIFAFAPYVERIAARPRLQAALRGITAAVVGVIGSLALWFAIHVLFAAVTLWQTGPVSLMLPAPASLDPKALAIAALSALLLLVRHWPLIAVLALSAALGAGLAPLG
jgi:chromate transporter